MKLYLSDIEGDLKKNQQTHTHICVSILFIIVYGQHILPCELKFKPLHTLLLLYCLMYTVFWKSRWRSICLFLYNESIPSLTSFRRGRFPDINCLWWFLHLDFTWYILFCVVEVIRGSFSSFDFKIISYFSFGIRSNSLDIIKYT